MNKIVKKIQFSEKVFRLDVEAPLIAKARKAGHFVIVRVDEKGERVPLTIAGSDTEKGTITLVIQTVGASTTKLCSLNEGDYIADVRTTARCSAPEVVSVQLLCCLSFRLSRLPETR